MHLVKLDQSISPPLLTTASSLDPSQETVQRRSEIEETKINDRFDGKKAIGNTCNTDLSTPSMFMYVSHWKVRIRKRMHWKYYCTRQSPCPTVFVFVFAVVSVIVFVFVSWLNKQKSALTCLHKTSSLPHSKVLPLCFNLNFTTCDAESNS